MLLHLKIAVEINRVETYFLKGLLEHEKYKNLRGLVKDVILCSDL